MYFSEKGERMKYRTEKDTLGEVRVPAERYWAAQTERSRNNFKIGTEKMPAEIISAFGTLKKAAALANNSLGLLDERSCKAICEACDKVISLELIDEFPLAVWQTGSGTQTNMNVNEVVANVGNELLGEKLLHPNDHVNMSQSSNDTFPSAMHIAAVTEISRKLIPSAKRLADEFFRLEEENAGIVKTGRTHLQDATPIAFSQEISGWRALVEKPVEMLEAALEKLSCLALGGTAVGTGLNAPPKFAETVAEKVGELTGISFVSAENKFHALTSKDELVFAHGAL